ncbi:MAG: GAF domain-containing protein [Anaerolinea sp.]|nr:GAF domain-containing protein [Anaerolinea sp.]
MNQIAVLVIIRRDFASRYYKNLSQYEPFNLTLVTDINDALEVLSNPDTPIDVLVLDNALDRSTEFISEVRHKSPRLLIVLVDEEADFAIPGNADELTTTPFVNDDLVRKINRLMSDRRLETLRADTIPHVRDFAKRLRKAAGEIGKQQAAVSACRDLGYDYVAFYRMESVNPIKVTLKAQDGAAAIQAVAPKQATPEDVIGWVAQMGETKVVSPQDELNHPLVKRGRLGAAAVAAVGLTNRYGVLVACRDQPGTITEQDVMLLELVSAQLAAVVSKEG